jgi:hypothetical protein
MRAAQRHTHSLLQVCCASFCPTNSNLLALGTAACQTRLYDMRRLNAPLGRALSTRAVSYVRFFRKHLFASIVNSSLHMYDVHALSTGASTPLVREFKGHLNERNFVGMAVSSEGYIFTGTEANEVVMYHESVPSVLIRQPVTGLDARASVVGKAVEKPMVSCVTVSKSGKYVVAGGAIGWVNVMQVV